MHDTLMYCAMPTRMQARREQVRKAAWDAGYVPVIPFDLGPYKHFEGNADFGRKRALEVMLKLQSCVCQSTGIFGISPGVMGELENALNISQPVRVFHGFDPDWEEEYEKLKGTYGDLLARLRGPHTLVVFVGSTAVGKTFWIDRLLKRFSGKLARVKNMTTRISRSLEDFDSYHFLTKADFETAVFQGKFLEHTIFRELYYGSSFEAMRNVLTKSHGIFALTPDGVAALYKHRLEFNLRFVVLQPETSEVLTRNLMSRNITDPEKQNEIWAKVPEFNLPANIPHTVVTVTGNLGIDEPRILSAIELS